MVNSICLSASLIGMLNLTAGNKYVVLSYTVYVHKGLKVKVLFVGAT